MIGNAYAVKEGTIPDAHRSAGTRGYGAAHTRKGVGRDGEWHGILSEPATKVTAVVVGCVCLYIVLCLCYRFYLCQYYGYYGFTYEVPTETSVILHLFIVVLISLQLLRLMSEPSVSNLTLALMLILNVLPATVMFTYRPAPHEGFYYLYWFMLVAFSWLIKPLRRSGGYARVDTLFSVVCVVITCVMTFSWAVYSHFNVQLSILDVYGTRIESRSYSMPTLILYMISASSMLIPLLIIWSYRSGHRCLFTLQCASALLYFWMYGGKGFLLIVVIALVACFYTGRMPRLERYPLTLAVIVALGLAFAHFFGRSTFIDVLIRRGMFVPVRLDYAYYDYFANRVPDFFRGSILRLFGFQSEYTNQGGVSGISFLIGLEYFGSAGMRANNGLFSDAFSNLGVAGVFVMPVLITALLKSFDTAAEDLDVVLLVLIAVMVSSTLISSSFFTNLITHGLLPLLLFIHLFPRPGLPAGDEAGGDR